jgi:hypothetical protein
MKYALIVLALLSSEALSKEKPVVEPGWILCMGPAAKYYPPCRGLLLDGPPPRIGK